MNLHGLGEKLIEQVGRLMKVSHCPGSKDEGHVFTWSSGSNEQLEAAVSDWLVRQQQSQEVKAVQALAIISGTEANLPPKIEGGRVVMQRGFSAKGHEDCVRLAQTTLKEIGTI